VDVNPRETLASFESSQVAILNGGHCRIDPALHADLGRTARDSVGHFADDSFSSEMIVGVASQR